jgi:ribosomal protein L33
MKKNYYLNCPECGKEYYLEGDLFQEQKQNPNIKLMCPYCRREFYGKDAKFKEQ